MIEIGKRFGKLTVVSEAGRKNSSNQLYYLCLCDCGNKREVVEFSLKAGKSHACTQCAYKSPDLVGKTIGKWLVVSRSSKTSKAGHAYFVCKCECGNTKDIRAYELKVGLSTQCQKCQGQGTFFNLGCKSCKCKPGIHLKNIEENECDLLGFCSRCDKFCCMNCSIDPLIGCTKK